MSREHCTIRRAIESLTACIYVHTGPLLSWAFSLRRFSPRQRGDEANMRYRATAKKLTTPKDTMVVCVHACVCVCRLGAHTHIHIYTHRHAGTERTRQSRIPIAPSRYEASCGAATIKAPVTHCSCSGQWVCTGDSAWFRTRLLSTTRKTIRHSLVPLHAFHR